MLTTHPPSSVTVDVAGTPKRTPVPTAYPPPRPWPPPAPPIPLILVDGRAGEGYERACHAEPPPPPALSTMPPPSLGGRPLRPRLRLSGNGTLYLGRCYWEGTT